MFTLLSTAASATLFGLATSANALTSDHEYLKETDRNSEPQLKVIDVYRRKEPTFVQGLYFDQTTRKLVESTGLNGESKTQWLEIVEPLGFVQPTLAVDMDVRFFGEGICPLKEGKEFIELTWKEGIVNILDWNTLLVKSQFKIWSGVKEGWGITLDDQNRILYVSNGSSTITKVDADTLE